MGFVDKPARRSCRGKKWMDGLHPKGLKNLADFALAYIFALLSQEKALGYWAQRRVGQSVKTRPFHGRMRGSIPLRGTQPGKFARFFYAF